MASARCAKIVESSAADNCYIGSAPGLVLGGCHGDDVQAVFKELCQIVDEAIALYEKDGKPVPNHGRKPAHSWDAYVTTPDPDALAAEFAARGVAIAVPITDTGDGLRGFVVEDLDGYGLFFGCLRS